MVTESVEEEVEAVTIKDIVKMFIKTNKDKDMTIIKEVRIVK